MEQLKSKGKCAQLHTPEARRKAVLTRFKNGSYTPNPATIKKLSEVQRGKLKTGRNARGPNNFAAKIWEFRDPNGITHRFVSLRHWIRENLHLFEHLEDPLLKSTLEERVRNGLKNMLLNTAKVPGSWHGWTAVSVIEKKENRQDLLQRNYVERLVIR